MNIKRIFHTHSILSYIISFLIMILLLYSIFAIYVSITLNSVIRKAIDDEPYENRFTSLISKEDYELLNPRQPELEEEYSIKIESSNTFPIVLPFLTDAYYKYSYTVTDTDTNEIIYGSSGCTVTVKLDYTSFPVHILDVIEAP